MNRIAIWTQVSGFLYRAFQSLTLWRNITLKSSIFNISYCLNSESVLLLQWRLPKLLQSIWIPWKLVYLSCGLKGLNCRFWHSKYLGLENKSFWIKNWYSFIISTPKHQRVGLNCHFQLSTDISVKLEKTCKDGFWGF